MGGATSVILWHTTSSKGMMSGRSLSFVEVVEIARESLEDQRIPLASYQIVVDPQQSRLYR